MKLTDKETLYKTSINIPIDLGAEMHKACEEMGINITSFGTIAIKEAVLKYKREKVEYLELQTRLKTLENLSIASTELAS